MSTVSFSLPDDVEQAFNATFAGQNKNAVIADLMREAVRRAQTGQQDIGAIERILAQYAHAPSLTEAELVSAREEGRP
jgi:metal-responsive CopG/Arc/MetJ family transcriptional regulator